MRWDSIPFFFARMDTQEGAERAASQSNELIWRGSASAGASNEIFTVHFFLDRYGAPDGFCFDLTRCTINDDPMMSDTRMEGENVAAQVEKYVQAILNQSATIQGHNEVMVLAGDGENAHLTATSTTTRASVWGGGALLCLLSLSLSLSLSLQIPLFPLDFNFAAASSYF